MAPKTANRPLLLIAGVLLLAAGIAGIFFAQSQKFSAIVRHQLLATLSATAVSAAGLALAGIAVFSLAGGLARKVFAIIAALVAAAEIVTGVAIGLTDHPGAYRPAGYYDFPVWCAAGTTLDVEKFETRARQNSSGIEVIVNLDARAVGPGRCIAALDVPPGASNLETDMHQVKASSRDQVAAAFSATDDPLTGQHRLSYRADGQKAGYGNVNVSLDITPAQTTAPHILPESDSLVSTRPVANAGYIRIDCADKNAFPEFPFPQDGQEISPGHVAWQTTVNGKGVGAHCIDTTERYWVNHATDLIVLGVGAILGALLALDRISKTPASADASR